MSTLNRQFAGYSIGEDCYSEIEKYTLLYGKRVLILGGKTALSKALNLIVTSLKESKIVDIVQLEYECTYKQINEIIETYKDSDIDMIFVVGGGKACDSGKTIADKMNLPVFTFPTIVSNCACYSAMTVIYKPDGSLDEFYFCANPAKHVFMNTNILINADERYLKAGIIDTIAKYYECHFASRNDNLDYHSALGREISNLCLERIQTNIESCLLEIKNNKPGTSFKEIVLTIIVNTGLVSQLVNDDYNCALAHSICYGLDTIESIAKNFLHGQLVGYGLLVQCHLDIDYKNENIVRNLLKLLDSPTTLKEFGLSIEHPDLKEIIKISISSPDMSHIPYSINEEMVYNSMFEIENH